LFAEICEEVLDYKVLVTFFDYDKERLKEVAEQKKVEILKDRPHAKIHIVYIGKGTF